jgi:DnaK suppressor protein
MNHEKYRQMLIAKERELTDLLSRTVVAVRERPNAGGLDTGDESVYSQQKEFVAAQAHLSTHLLAEVQAALKRIGEGTYGRCLADGEMIAKPRLDAVPWASYCLHHQGLIDEQSVEPAA